MITELSTIGIAVLGASTLSLLVLVTYYFYFFTGLQASEALAKEEQRPFSIIIAARNERENLEQNLPAILNQDYPNFEVVVVNDGSWDGTKEYLKELSLQVPKLKVVTVNLDEKFRRGKKFALTLGIKGASHEHLLFTDADCKPASDKWLQNMANAMGNADMAIGNSPLTVKRTLLGSIVNYETFHTAVQYFGYANRKQPYMGVGRNLAYTKTLFFDNKGFASHQHIMSGDDDLFVQEVATKSNTSICLSPESFTYSHGPNSFKEWITQKTRHLSTGQLYKGRFKILLGTYSLFQLLIYILSILFIILHPRHWWLGMCPLAVKWLIQWTVILGPSKKLGYKRVGYALPYYDLLYTLFLFFFGITKPFMKPKTWN
ncbi:MAG: glycosyltransferase [Bacteroidetes bacterium]|jgi:poly-beta-1,6-N-acetyl-D-glucosamine synthase|nr:glycosyltransferase [Bacteroidota bacterium]